MNYIKNLSFKKRRQETGDRSQNNSAIRNPQSAIRKYFFPLGFASSWNTQHATRNADFGLPILSGILLILIQPPVSLFPLAFVSLIPLFYSLKKDNLRYSFISGFIAGIVSYLGLVYWVVIAMNRYGGINIYLSFLILLLFVLYLSLYTGCFALSVSYLEERLSIPFFLSAPIIWVLLEYLRGIALSGFPWSLLAHSQHNFLSFIQITSITGTYFISYLIVAANCIIYSILRRKSVSIVYIVIISICFIASLIYGYRILGKQDKGTLTVAIVQGNIRQDVKWDDAFKIKTIRTYYNKTVEAGENTHLVVWPETAMPFIFEQEIQLNRFIKALPTLLNTYLLFGAVSKDKQGKHHNSAYILGKNDELVGTYSKVHLVPFGEYTPLASYFPFLEKITASGGDFSPGEPHKPIETGIGSIGILICYEGTFPYITNETVRKGAQVLVNITNDAWYDRTSAPYQHFAFYIFRAIETDRYVLRSANTGISAIIDPQGRIKLKTPIFTEGILKGRFSMKNTKTFYVKYGDYFILLVFMFLIIIVTLRFYNIPLCSKG